MSLAIILGFAALLMLLACALLWSRWPGWLKGMLVLAVTALYFVGNAAIHGIWGLPSTDALPERFMLLSAVVEEPTTRGAGSIYMWVSELHEGKPTLEPRSFKLPYSKELHGMVNEGMKRGRDGVNQMGTAEIKPGKVGTSLPGLKPGNDEQEVKVKDMPAPQLPEK